MEGQTNLVVESRNKGIFDLRVHNIAWWGVKSDLFLLQHPGLGETLLFVIACPKLVNR